MQAGETDLRGWRLMLIGLEGRHKLCLMAAESIEQKVRRSFLLASPLTSPSSDSWPHTEGLDKQKWPLSTVAVWKREVCKCERTRWTLLFIVWLFADFWSFTLIFSVCLASFVPLVLCCSLILLQLAPSPCGWFPTTKPNVFFNFAWQTIHQPDS